MFLDRKAFAWLLSVEAVFLALAIVVTTGAIPDWGHWYSPALNYRRQTDAFFRGELALSHRPVDVEHDLTWSCDGVHQVWGLGIPAWRFPFEVLARLCGQEAFPDRIAFAAALTLWAWFVLRTLLPALETDPAKRPWSLGTGLVAALMVLANPCFVSLCSVRFSVYEEAVVYEYIFGTALLMGLLRVSLNTSFKSWCWLAFLAGLGPLVRPPLLFYGFATLLLGSWVCRKELAGRHWWKALLPAGLWCVGGGILYCTNLVRFGSGFEFGHSLNLQTLFGSMYATRFDDPFRKEPLLPALREMWGMLFEMDQFNGFDFYAAEFFRGQSTTLRWREFYFTTYDVSWIAVWIAGLAAGIGRWKKMKPMRSETKRLAPVLAWGAGVALVLVAFYLRNCVVSSRYMADIAPAFAALLLGATLLLLSRLERSGRWAWNLGAVALLGWLAWQVGTMRSSYGPPRAFDFSAMRENLLIRPPEGTPLPRQYRTDASLPSDSSLEQPETEGGLCGLRYNGVGWNRRTGSTRPLVIFFMDDIQFVELDLSPTQETSLTETDWRWVRIKVGLEKLSLESSTPTAEGGCRLRFIGPLSHGYSTGIQVGYLALGPPSGLNNPASPFRLNAIRWKPETHAAHPQ